MHAGIGSPTSNHADLILRHPLQGSLEHALDRFLTRLYLPTSEVRSVIRDRQLKRASHDRQTFPMGD